MVPYSAALDLPHALVEWVTMLIVTREGDRPHRIIRICERQGVPVLADRAYQGAGPWVTTGRKRPPGGELSPTQHTVNRALAQARAPVEREMARLKSWRILRRSRVSPSHPAMAG
ncbi:transposase family protein [Streptomyces zaomyceticus]